jgi:hypothetical protein
MRTTNLRTKHEVLAAEKSFWHLYGQLAARKGPINIGAMQARLQPRLTGRGLWQILGVLVGNAIFGRYMKGTVAVKPTLLAATTSTARIRDCFRYSLFQNDGTFIGGANPGLHQALLTFTRVHGVWKMSLFKNEGPGCHM